MTAQSDEDLEQERLELVVGPVDLVDQQDRRGAVARVPEGPEERAGGRGTARRTARPRPSAPSPLAPGGLGGAEVEQLAGVVPLVDAPGRRRCPRSTGGGAARRRSARPAPWPPRSCRRRPRPRAAAAAAGAARGTATWPGPRRPGSRRSRERGRSAPATSGRKPHRPSRHHAGCAYAPASSRARRTSTLARWVRYSTLALRSACGSALVGRVLGRVGGAGPAGERVGRPPAARSGVEPMFTRPTPVAAVAPHRGDADDGPVLGAPVELLERPAGAGHLRHPDLGEQLVGLERRLEEAGEEVRRPRSPARPGPTGRRAMPPRASTTAGRSDAGSAWASEPPMVPRWRTWGSPTWPAAWARIGTWACSRSRVLDVVVAGQGADGDVVAAVADVGEVAAGGRRR